MEAPPDFHDASFFDTRAHLFLPRLVAIASGSSVDACGGVGWGEGGRGGGGGGRAGGEGGRGQAKGLRTKHLATRGHDVCDTRMTERKEDGALEECAGQGDRVGGVGQRDVAGRGAQGECGSSASRTPPGGEGGEEDEMHELERRGDVGGMLALNWRRYAGRLCVGVDWDRFSLAQLDDMVRCVGGRVVERICRLLARDFDVWSHGLPDLVVWNPQTAASLLVEVKVCNVIQCNAVLYIRAFVCERERETER